MDLYAVKLRDVLPIWLVVKAILCYLI